MLVGSALSIQEDGIAGESGVDTPGARRSGPRVRVSVQFRSGRAARGAGREGNLRRRHSIHPPVTRWPPPSLEAAWTPPSPDYCKQCPVDLWGVGERPGTERVSPGCSWCPSGICGCLPGREQACMSLSEVLPDLRPVLRETVHRTAAEGCFIGCRDKACRMKAPRPVPCLDC